MLDLWQGRLQQALFAAFAVIAVYGCFSVGYLALILAAPDRPAFAAAAGLICASIGAALVWGGGSWAERAIDYGSEFASRWDFGRWIAFWLATGMIVRIVWVVCFPAAQTSDGASYLAGAWNIVAHGTYESGDARAYWPPGLPFSLVPTMLVFGNAPYVPVLNNLVWFCGTLVVAVALAREFFGERSARLVAPLIAIWPNLVFQAGLASKELLVAFLLPLWVLLYLLAVRRALPALAFGAGLTLGFAVLVQPSCVLLVLALVFYECLNSKDWRASGKRIALVGIAAALVIAPWTYRNYLIFGEAVLVSNTGGISLYVGNNPRATGGYVDANDRLGHLDELTANRVAREAALEWIRQNPASFLKLIPSKQILFLGDDSGGAFGTLRRGLGIDGPLYLAAKGLSNLFWLALIALAGSAVWRQRQNLRGPPSLLILVFFYFFAVHSIVESGSRHHVALSVLVGVLATAFVRPSAADRALRPVRRPGTRTAGSSTS